MSLEKLDGFFAGDLNGNMRIYEAAQKSDLPQMYKDIFDGVYNARLCPKLTNSPEKPRLFMWDVSDCTRSLCASAKLRRGFRDRPGAFTVFLEYTYADYATGVMKVQGIQLRVKWVITPDDADEMMRFISQYKTSRR